MTVFISHANDDAVIAKRIEDLIAYDGYQSWRFQRDMMGANPADPQLPSNIEASEKFLFCISDHSQSSEICQKELQHAALLQKPLVTVRLNRGTCVPPPLNDHQWVDYDESPESTVQLLKALRNAKAMRWEKIPGDWTTWDGTVKAEKPAVEYFEREIPLPRIRRYLTDMEKENFLDESIGKIRNYFNQALISFENSDPRVNSRIGDETDMRSFTCEIHIDGKLSKRCTIWIYNQYGTKGIAYYETDRHIAIFGKQPYQELAQVAELDGNPALKFTLGIGFTTQRDDCQICTVEKASGCLWRYFIRDIDEASTYW